jgi:mono/diheme cytochrome c family protein
MKSIRKVSLVFCLVAGFAVAAQGQTPEAGQARGGRGGNAGAAGARGGRGGVGTTPAPTSPVTGNAVEGKKLYFSYSCYSCHGYNGETGRAFVGTWGNLQTEAGFIAFLRLRADRAPEQPATSMPNFPEKTLSDKQAKDIYAYIRTFKSNSPEVKDIPTLNAIVNAASRPYKP